MEIQGIIIHKSKDTICCDKTVLTFKEVNTFDYFQRILLYVYDLTTDLGFFLDYNQLCAEQPVFKNEILDWAEFEQYLRSIDGTVLFKYKTKSLVPAMMSTIVDGVLTKKYTPFKSNMSVALEIYPVENKFDIDVAYSNRETPAIRNKFNLKWMLPDLVFTNTKHKAPINFKNTIPSINGMICFPSIFEDELFALQGAKLLTRMRDTNKNILLIDFSPLGELTHHRLCDCEKVYIKHENVDITPASDPTEKDNPVKFDRAIKSYVNHMISVKCILPKGSKKGIPILNVFGRMFFPHDFDISLTEEGASLVLTFSLSRQMIERIILSSLQKHKRQITNTNIIKVIVEKAIETLFNNPDSPEEDTEEQRVILKYSDKSIPFISILDTDAEVYFDYIEQLKVIYPDKMIFKKNIGGLLVNKETREFVDYTRVHYDPMALVTVAPQEPLQILTRDNPNELTGLNVGFGLFNPVKFDLHNEFHSFVDLKDIKNYKIFDIAVIVSKVPLLCESPIIPRIVSTQEEHTDTTPVEEVKPIETPEPIVLAEMSVDRLTSIILNVTNAKDAPLNGLYILENPTSKGFDRIWNKVDEEDAEQIIASIGYSTIRSCWYIKMSDGHYYEAPTILLGSSPWHTTLTWQHIEV